MRISSKFGMAMFAGAMTLAGFASQANALNWKGYTWLEDTPVGGDSWAIDGGGNAVLSTTGAGTAPRALRIVGVDSFSMGTNWAFSFSFIDNQLADTSWPVIEAFWNGTGGGSRNFRGSIGANAPLDQNDSWRLEAGAATANQLGTGLWGQTVRPVPDGDDYLGHYAETKFSPLGGDSVDNITGGTKRTPQFAVSAGSSKPTVSADTLAGSGIGTLVPRVDGQTVTVNVEKQANGVINYTWIIGANSYSYTQNFFNNSSASVAAAWQATTLDQIELRVVGTIGAADQFVFTNFSIPEPASLGLLSGGAVLMLARRRKTA